MKTNMNILNSLAEERSEKSLEQVTKRKENRDYLRISKRIALNIHYYLREKHISQKELSERMGVSAAYIGKLMKGGENLTLETICKLQVALGETLIQISEPYVCISSWQKVLHNNMAKQERLSKSHTYAPKRYSNNTYIAAIGDIA